MAGNIYQAGMVGMVYAEQTKCLSGSLPHLHVKLPFEQRLNGRDIVKYCLGGSSNYRTVMLVNFLTQPRLQPRKGVKSTAVFLCLSFVAAVREQFC